MKKLLFLILFLPELIFAQDNSTVLGYQALGSPIKAMTIGASVVNIYDNYNMYDGRLWLTPVYLQKAATITGVKVYMAVQGNYTADNNNRIGLYTVSGGTATLVASCADDGNLWKATANTFITKAFSTPYVATAGLYYVAVLYNNSAQVAAPAMGKLMTISNAGVNAVDFTNSNILSGWVAATDLTTPLTMSTLTKGIYVWWVAIY